MKKVVISLVCILSILLTAYSQQREELFDKVALVVNSEPVLKSDIEFAKQWYNVKNNREAEEKLVDSIIVYQQASKVGISVSSKEVEQAILNIAKANSIYSLEEFKKKLSQEEIPYEKLREFIRRDLVVNRFLQFYLRQTMSKGVIEGELQEIKKVRIIFISKEREEYSKLLRDISKKLTRDNFPVLAKQLSDDKFTADNDGLLGEVKKGDLVKELDEAVFSHKVGDIFNVETEKGTYFVYIESEGKKLLPREDFEKSSLDKFKKEYQVYLKKLKEQTVIQRL
ncbi:MAG: peptidyl-prolyl cis-trans isomerase SurA [Hydrogenothermaceae bacterium]|nr:peptidyl-prolyl cis-trans isomerase SurA [Hydrogenothermaceae bacterium]